MRTSRTVMLGALAVVAALTVAGCSAASTPEESALDDQGCIQDFDASTDYFPDKAAAEHANGWDVQYENSYKVVTTTVDAAGGHATSGSRQLASTYVLLQCGAPEPELTGELADATVVQIPVETLADGGSVLYAALERLDVAEALVGEAERFVGDVEAPFLPKIAAQVDSGAVAELGYEVNLEALAEADPDFYTNYAGDEAMFAQIEALGIPVVYYFPYTESPLGAAEQLKFTSLFFNLEAEANSQFADIETRYNDLKARITSELTASDAPTVLVGVLGDDGVNTLQNERFEMQLIAEVGGVAIPHLPGGGRQTVSVESFLDEGADADYWLDLVFFPSNETSADYLASDPRTDVLDAVHDGTVFYRIGPRGQDYFLSGAVDADVILADMASIIHPGLLPDHEVVFFGLVEL